MERDIMKWLRERERERESEEREINIDNEVTEKNINREIWTEGDR